MAVKSSKETNRLNYDADIQQELLNKYKSANQWFWSAFKRYPIQYIIATIVLLISTYTSAKTLALVGDIIGIIRDNIKASLPIFSVAFNETILLMITFVIISWVCLSINIYLWYLI